MRILHATGTLRYVLTDLSWRNCAVHKTSPKRYQQFVNALVFTSPSLFREETVQKSPRHAMEDC